MKYIISAYYYRSECSYAFGPFESDQQLNRFLAKDKNLDRDGQPLHEEWHVTAINLPSKYGTGEEIKSNIWRWDHES